MRRLTAISILVLLSASACRGSARNTTTAAPLSPQPTAAELAENAAAERAEFRCADLQPPDWPMAHRDASRRGVSEAPALSKPVLAWSRPNGIAQRLNGPVIANSLVFAPSSGHVAGRADAADGVGAFDLNTGDKLWFHALHADAGAAAYEGCRLFVTAADGTVRALDARDGATLWSYRREGAQPGFPLPRGELVVVGFDDGTLVALDAVDGTMSWRVDAGGPVRSAPAADFERVYLTTGRPSTTAIWWRDGKIAWSDATWAQRPITDALAAPVVRGDTVYAGYVRESYAPDPALSAIDVATGAHRWEAQNPNDLRGGWGSVRAAPALVDDRLVWADDHSDRIASADATSGVVLASTPAGACMLQQWASPVVASGVAYVPRHDGGLYAYEVESGTRSWSMNFDGERVEMTEPPGSAQRRCLWEPQDRRPLVATPAIANTGQLAVATSSGWLHVVGHAHLAQH